MPYSNESSHNTPIHHQSVSAVVFGNNSNVLPQTNASTNSTHTNLNGNSPSASDDSEFMHDEINGKKLKLKVIKKEPGTDRENIYVKCDLPVDAGKKGTCNPVKWQSRNTHMRQRHKDYFEIRKGLL